MLGDKAERWRGWAGSGAELSDEDATEDAVDGGDGISGCEWDRDVRCEEMFATELCSGSHQPMRFVLGVVG